MASNYRKLGDVIKLVDERNTDGNAEELLGVAIEKRFMPSVANVIGTDLSKYKLVSKDRFACNPMHVGRDEKLPIARYDAGIPAIVSPAYFTFDVASDKVLPRYLELWFNRSEFDRRCWFATDASVRGGLSWDAICDIPIDLPTVEEQGAVINRFDAIEARISQLRRLNDKLAASAGALFEEECAQHPEWRVVRMDEICQVKGGKRLPAGEELSAEVTDHPYIRVRDLNGIRHLIYDTSMAHISASTQKQIARYFVSEGDVIISIVGTIGLTAIINASLNKANLTENCDKLTNFKGVNPLWVYLYLNSADGKAAIADATVGAVQAKLPLKNIQALRLPVPSPEDKASIDQKMTPLFNVMELNQKECQMLMSMRGVLLDSLASSGR